MFYIGSKGPIEISKMPDAYLVNAYLKHKKRLDLLKTKLKNQDVIANYIGDLQVMVANLRQEVKRRNLLDE